MRNRDRVLRGRPWLFDNHLFVLKIFDGHIQPSKIYFDKEFFWVQLYNLPIRRMNRKVGESIGNMVGRVVDEDVSENGVSWGDFLRVRIK